jgi:hypothetical protein
MKRYNDLKRLSNAVLTFSNTDRLSGEQSNAVKELIEMQKEIIQEGMHEPRDVLIEVVEDE